MDKWSKLPEEVRRWLEFQVEDWVRLERRACIERAEKGFNPVFETRLARLRLFEDAHKILRGK